MSIDTGFLAKHGVLNPGQWAGRWRVAWNHSRGEETAAMMLEVNTIVPGQPILRVRHLTGNGTQRGDVYSVRLERTRPRYGGVRWWFICPLTGKRAAKVYLPPGGRVFASRKGHGLKYHSQGVPVKYRPLARALTVRVRLGGSPDTTSPFPARPKGMWRRTYERMKGRHDGALGRPPACQENP